MAPVQPLPDGLPAGFRAARVAAIDNPEAMRGGLMELPLFVVINGIHWACL